jgi:hypothetical protein
MTVHPLDHGRPNLEVRDFGAVRIVLRNLWSSLVQTRKGKLECVTEFTLNPSVATTTLNYHGLSPQSVLIFDPKTANAATEKAAGTLYALEANRQNNQWVITHANNAQTDRKYQVAIIG